MKHCNFSSVCLQSPTKYIEIDPLKLEKSYIEPQTFDAHQRKIEKQIPWGDYVLCKRVVPE